MTFPVDYDKFTILSKVRNHITIRIFRRANITHKPTFSFGGYFSSVTNCFVHSHISFFFRSGKILNFFLIKEDNMYTIIMQ